MADRIVVMNQGVIEQIGTPVEIYREPATAFVADFIGTMNFVAGAVIGPGKVRLGTVELACVADGLDQGAPVSIAVRPEDIVIQGVTGEEENTFPARIASMEFLGSFYRADLVGEALGEARLQADFSINLVRRLELNEGSAVRVMMPSERIRIYPRGAAHA
jgi:iron(III) transport system ATP-binding protein